MGKHTKGRFFFANFYKNILQKAVKYIKIYLTEFYKGERPLAPFETGGCII